jgi:hypothetical protein
MLRHSRKCPNRTAGRTRQAPGEKAGTSAGPREEPSRWHPHHGTDENQSALVLWKSFLPAGFRVRVVARPGASAPGRRDKVAVRNEPVGLAFQSDLAMGSDNAGSGQLRSNPGVTRDANSTDQEQPPWCSGAPNAPGQMEYQDGGVHRRFRPTVLNRSQSGSSPGMKNGPATPPGKAGKGIYQRSSPEDSREWPPSLRGDQKPKGASGGDLVETPDHRNGLGCGAKP